MNVQLKRERHLRIIHLVQGGQKVTIADLAKEVGVSEVTIQRDLLELAKLGLIHRVYGGAIIAQVAVMNPPVLQRISLEKEAKELIGHAAAALVKDGESVFISSGSTTAYVARNLVHRPKLAVITNALNVATELSSAEGVTVIVVGGILRPAEMSLFGHITDQGIREVRVDKVIMGIPAISVKAGLSDDYLPGVMTDRAILAMSPQVILVADHTKFGKVASGYVAPLERVATLVTDPETSPSDVEQIRAMGTNVIVAGEDTEHRNGNPS